MFVCLDLHWRGHPLGAYHMISLSWLLPALEGAGVHIDQGQYPRPNPVTAHAIRGWIILAKPPLRKQRESVLCSTWGSLGRLLAETRCFGLSAKEAKWATMPFYCGRYRLLAERLLYTWDSRLEYRRN